MNVNFLDLSLQGYMVLNKVVTSLYRKPLSGNTVLRANICHPKYMILAIPKGEYIWARRACSNEDDREFDKINKRLRDRGYKKWMWKNTECEVQSRKRDELFLEKRRMKWEMTIPWG